jgi:hypothetical protein
VPNQEDDHVTSYYSSTIDWQLAQKIYPPDNPININISVTRIIPLSGNSFFSGTITTMDINNNIVPLSGAIVIAEQGINYRNAAITDSRGEYTLDSLSIGTFTVMATKIGYRMDSINIIITGNSINSNPLKLKLNRVIKTNPKVTIQTGNNFNLYQNYPNPFNPETSIKFFIPNLPFSKGIQDGTGVSVSLKIYNLLGMEIAELVNDILSPGLYEIKWNALNYSGGVYFYKLTHGVYSQCKKMIIIK